MVKNMNTKTKTFGIDGKGQFSYFFVRLYANDHDQVQKLCNQLKLRHYAFILHDKDIYHESDENHVEGDIKPPHYHICMNLTEKKSWKQLKKLILDFLPKSSPRVQDMEDTVNCFMYLIHNTEKAIKEKKHLYNSNEVVSDDVMLWTSEEFRIANKQEKVDTLSSFIQDTIDNGYISLEMYEYYRKTYGRDFILNVHRAFNYLIHYFSATDIPAGSSTDLFIPPEKRKELYN